MLCKPKPFYDEKKKLAIGYKNPLYLTKAKQVQPALYNGHELVKTTHAPAIVNDSEDTLELAETTRMKMLEKSKKGEWGFKQTKECYLTEVIPFFKTLKEHFEGIQTALVKEVKEMKEIFKQMEAKVEQNAMDKQCADIERKNLLIENENLIANCLVNELLYSVMNDVFTVSTYSELHDAYTKEQARCLELEAGISKLIHKIQKDDHSEMIKSFSNLEIDHLNLQLKYQNLKERFGNKKSQPSQDTPEFDKRRSEADRILDFKALDFQNIELTEKVTALQEQNKIFRVENEKVKQHYKELYDSIKITRAKTIEKTTSLLTKNETLKAQLKGKMQCVTMPAVKPKLLTPGVISSTEASGSKPRSNTKNNRILPAKSDNKKQWKPTERKFTLGEQCPLTRFTKSKVVPLQQHKHVSSSDIVITEQLDNTCQKPLTRYKRRNKHDKAISTSIPITAETQTIDASVKYTAVVQIVLWYLDSGCSKHMTRNRSRLKNFVKKFIGTVRFGNDHFGAIMGYRDYVIGDNVISRVYYVEGLGHNLLSIGQFCDLDLEVAFKKHSCYVRNKNGVDLLKGSHGSNLYTISVEDMIKSSPICLLSKASKNKSWLWHHRLNHLNFGTINDLAGKDLVRGLPRLKFEKDHLCSACQLGKSKKYTHKSKSENTIMEVLHTLHIDMCGPIRVQKFVNQVLTEFYESVGIFYQKSVLRTPQQNVIVERRNCTLVEAARTMLKFSKALMFLWAESVTTACYT
ncbi:retrovirus-related pol polyprotein from transposon TNT 1-94 [Tanacetum coccineum]